MKQLIENQMKEFREKFLSENNAGQICWSILGIRNEPVIDWHKQSLKQFIDGLIEEANVRVATLEELKAKFNLEIDEHRIDEVGRYISYLKKLKEELN